MKKMFNLHYPDQVTCKINKRKAFCKIQDLKLVAEQGIIFFQFIYHHTSAQLCKPIQSFY